MDEDTRDISQTKHPVAARSLLAAAFHVLLPPALLILGIVLTLFLSQLERYHQHKALTDKTILQQRYIARRFGEVVYDHLYPLLRLRSIMAGDAEAPAELFEQDALRALMNRGSYQWIGWIDGDRRLRQLLAPPSPVGAPPDRPLMTDPGWQRLIDRAIQEGLPTLGLSPVASGPSPLLLLVPALVGEEGEPHLAGAVVAAMDTESLLEQAVPQDVQVSYMLEIRDERGTLLLRRGGPPAAVPATTPEPMRLAGKNWTAYLAPTPRFVQENLGRAPSVLFWGGMVLSFLLAASSALWQLQRRRHDRQTRQHLLSLERLSEISTTLSSRLGSSPLVLDQLAELSCSLLSADMTIIGSVERPKNVVHALAATGVRIDRTRPMALADLPATYRCVSTGQVIRVDDREKEDQSLNYSKMDELGMRAMLELPLRIEGRIVGVIVIGSRKPRRWSDREMRLALLLASQSAVLLVNHRLYGQMNQALRNQRRLLEQRELLSNINAAIYQAATLDESLGRVVSLAPKALGVDACAVLLVSDNPDRMELAAVTPTLPIDPAIRRIHVNGTLIQQALQTRQMRVVNNTASDSAQAPLRRLFNAQAIVCLPLIASNREPMGVLLMICHRSGIFIPQQLGLAQLFVTRASAAIENARLHQQARRDADTKAILLRELNHRVKNSLAGIVTLLSINEPRLSNEARQWLDRAIERIRNMARTYELFSGNIDQIGLEELIQQVIASIAVIKPPAVRIQVDLHDLHTPLGTEQALALAMVLHELCFNALVHGLGKVGTLTIQAWEDDGGILTVQVADEGTADPRDKPARRGGIGLDLVRGLVARELRGGFSVARTDTGGTTATVAFSAQTTLTVASGA